MKPTARRLIGRLRRSPHRDTVAIVVLAAILLSTMVVFAPRQSDDPAEVVREFLTAAQQGDVDRALELAGQSRPSGDKAAFLTPEATAGEWSVTRAHTVLQKESTDYPDDDFDDPIEIEQAVVEFDVSIPDHADTSGSIAIQREAGDSDWTFAEQLTTVSFPYTPLWYNEVNGERAAAKAPKEDSTSGRQSYTLLPGVYKLYSDVADLVEVTDNTIPLFPQQDEVTSFDPDYPPVDEFRRPDIRLTPAGEDAIEKRIKTRIDDCAAKNAAETEGCPFGADPAGVRTADDEYHTDLDDVSWTIKDYPEIAVVPDSEFISVTDRKRGAATLKIKSEGDEKIDCQIRTSSLQLGFKPDGSLEIVPDGERFGGGDRYLGEGDTCSMY